MVGNQKNLEQLELARLLASRLERLSADSTWAHRASGIRGSLLRMIDQIEKSADDPQQPDREALKSLDRLLRLGYYMLEKAAQELML